MQDGLTGLILATQNGFQEIVQTLLKNGADPNITEIVSFVINTICTSLCDNHCNHV